MTLIHQLSVSQLLCLSKVIYSEVSGIPKRVPNGKTEVFCVIIYLISA